MKAADVLQKFYGDHIVLPVDPVAIACSEGINVRPSRFGGTYKESVLGYIEKRDGMVRIVINQDMPATRRRFTCAHELAHFFLHHKGHELEFLDLRSTVRTRQEQEADTFAAELLMPEQTLRDEHASLLFPTVEELARRFGVSKQSMSIRLAKLNLSAF